MNRPLIADQTRPNWQMISTIEKFTDKQRIMVRVMGKQIALFNTDSGFFACDNRCPHEGYPLSEGSVSGECTLTCNWHNWKFNLATGDNLFGGDRLRTYPLEIRGNEIWIDIKEPPYAEKYNAIVKNLKYAFDNESYDQIARECARLIRIGADPMDALRMAIDWSWEKMEFGWTHAYAGMADWLALYDEYDGDPEVQLTCLLEAMAHTAFDVLREPVYAFTSASMSYDEDQFLQAIEEENEETAVAMIAGGLDQGMVFADFEPALSTAALAHYNDFGHSLIYVTKAEFLIRRLGQQVARSLLLSLVRSFVYAARENQIPEFRQYQPALERWGTGTSQTIQPEDWYRKSINGAMKQTVNASNLDPLYLYNNLLIASAVSMLGYDISQQSKVRITVSGNVGWLDFTHGLTFANAVRQQCSKFPQLWPQALLQMSCFIGRNAAYTMEQYALEDWAVADPDDCFGEFIEAVLAHGQGEHIVSVHLLKTTLAVRQESQLLDNKSKEILVASLNRFLNSPLKRRLPRRVAYQSLKFVGEEV